MVTPENLEEDLREACAMGDEGKAQSLIASGAKVNNANKINGWTALHWASYRGHRNIVMILLNKGADPSLKNTKGETVLDLLSGHTLDLLAGNEVEEASQYPLPLEDLPIVPNYIKNPEFPYTMKDSGPAVLPSTITTNPQNEGESKLNEFFKGLMEKMKKEKGEGEEASVVPTPMDTGSGPSSPRHPQGVAVTAEPRREPQPAVKITTNIPYGINPHLIPNPAMINPQIPQPQLGRQFIPYRHTTYKGQTYISNTQNIARFNNNQLPQITHIEPYPVQHRTYNTPNNPNMYNTRPVQQYQVVVQHPAMHPHRHMISRVPVPIVAPMPTILQPQTPPRSDETREYTTPTRKSPPTSPNSTHSTPPEATLKVRKSGTSDFFEVDLTDIGDTYASLVECFADELELDKDKVCKVRKLPNILIRKDRDVKRIKAGAEFEVEVSETDS